MSGKKKGDGSGGGRRDVGGGSGSGKVEKREKRKNRKRATRQKNGICVNLFELQCFPFNLTHRITSYSLPRTRAGGGGKGRRDQGMRHLKATLFSRVLS